MVETFAEAVVIQVSTTAGRSVEIYVSPQGRSLRVFQGGQEMTNG
jgi:hypothetical protein